MKPRVLQALVVLACALCLRDWLWTDREPLEPVIDQAHCGPDRGATLDQCEQILVDSPLQGVAKSTRFFRQLGDTIPRSSLTQVLTDQEARTALLNADVILVGDVHGLPGCASTCRLLCRDFLIGTGSKEGDIVVALEHVPVTMQSELDVAVSSTRRGHALLDLLQDAWAWPVVPLAAELSELARLGVRLVAAGESSPSRVRDDGVPDMKRRPASKTRVQIENAWNDANSVVLRTAASLLLESGKRNLRRLVIFYGIGHLENSEGAIAPRLRKLGLSVVVVIPFATEWERRIWRRFGKQSCEAWVQVAPSVLRPPYVSPESVLRAQAEWRR